MGRKNTNPILSFLLINTKKINKSSGFTLSEALVVVAILGIFILLVIAALRPSVQIAKSQDSKRKSDLNTISIALEDYLNDHPCYPEPAVMECTPGTGLRPYLNKIPCDPKTNQSYPYARPDGCTQFAIYANLQTETMTEEYNYVATSPNLRIAPTLIPTMAEGSTLPTSFPTSPSGGGTPISTPTAQSGIWGCYSGVCTPLPGFICQPNWAYDNCLGRCGTSLDPQNECEPL